MDENMLQNKDPAKSETSKDLESVIAAAEAIYNNMHLVVPGFETREKQISGIREICRAYVEKRVLKGEYPCGTGKSFMYVLAALAYYKIFKKRTLFVTENISLQEQLGDKDLPMAVEAYKKTFAEDSEMPAFKSMKGRANYVCNLRMTQMRDAMSINQHVDGLVSRDVLKQLLAWETTTRTGDMSEVSFIPPYDVLKLITVTDSSSGGCALCPQKKDGSCYYYSERKKFLSAPLGVLNYHLFFSALNSQEHIVIGDFSNIVFDEAHNLTKIARDFEEKTLSVRSIQKIKKLLTRVNMMSVEADMYDAFSSVQFEPGLDQIANTIAMSYTVNSKEIGLSRFRMKQSIPMAFTIEMMDDISEALKRLSDQIRDYTDDILPLDIEAYTAMQDEASVAVKSLALQITDHIDELSQFAEELAYPDIRQTKETYVYWMENHSDGKGGYYTSAHKKPYIVNNYMQRKIMHREIGIVMVSATLAVSGKFDFLNRELGIVDNSEDIEIVEGSPFDLIDQELWFLPENVGAGNTSDQEKFMNVSITNISKILEVSGGGMLCLFTSIKSMDIVTEKIRRLHPKLRILKQNDSPRRVLLEKFSKDVNSCLFATKSFFTGIDVKGPSLRVLVIEKLPFESPDDPVSQKLGSADGGFMNYTIPSMIMDLKQAIGRGIRSKDDRCLIMFLDERISKSKYAGKISKTFAVGEVHNSRTRSLDDARAFLKSYVPDPSVFEGGSQDIVAENEYLSIEELTDSNDSF